MRYIACLCLFAVALLAGGCSATWANEFNGLTTPDGPAIHGRTTNIALHALFAWLLIGDATIPRTVADHTKAVK